LFPHHEGRHEQRWHSQAQPFACVSTAPGAKGAQGRRRFLEVSAVQAKLPATSGSLMPPELPNSNTLLPGDKSMTKKKISLVNKLLNTTEGSSSARCPGAATAGTRAHRSTPSSCRAWALTKTCRRVRQGPVLSQLTSVKIH